MFVVSTDCSILFWADNRGIYSSCLVLLEAGEFAVMCRSVFCDITAPVLIIALLTHHPEFCFGQSGLCNHLMIHPDKRKPGYLDLTPDSPHLFSKLLKLTVSQFAQL